MCIILVANIISASATQCVLLLFMISPFSAIVADVSAQFATSQLSDIIVLPRIKWRHFSATKS